MPNNSATITTIPHPPLLLSFLSFTDIIHLLSVSSFIRRLWEDCAFHYLLSKHFPLACARHHQLPSSPKSIYVAYFKTRRAWARGRSQVPSKISTLRATRSRFEACLFGDCYVEGYGDSVLVVDDSTTIEVIDFTTTCKVAKSFDDLPWQSGEVRHVAFGGKDSFLSCGFGGASIVSGLTTEELVMTSFRLPSHHAGDSGRFIAGNWSSISGIPDQVVMSSWYNDYLLVWNAARPDICVREIALPALDSFAPRQEECILSLNMTPTNHVVTAITSANRVMTIDLRVSIAPVQIQQCYLQHPTTDPRLVDSFQNIIVFAQHKRLSIFDLRKSQSHAVVAPAIVQHVNRDRIICVQCVKSPFGVDSCFSSLCVIGTASEISPLVVIDPWDTKRECLSNNVTGTEFYYSSGRSIIKSIAASPTRVVATFSEKFHASFKFGATGLMYV